VATGAETDGTLKAVLVEERQTVRLGQPVARVDLARTSLREREAALDRWSLARLRLVAGMATSLDTVTAQSALAQTEESEIRARYDYYLAAARRAHARGDVMLFFEE